MPARHGFTQVDAFADRRFSGNPAGVVRFDGWPADALLQKIAAELALPATAFVVDAAGGPALRWFSPVAELRLCGHATLAAGHVVLGSGDDRGAGLVRFRTRHAGLLEVARAATGYRMSLPSLKVTARALPRILDALGLDARAGRRSWVIETLWHDGGYALIVVEDARQVAAVAPDFVRLAAAGNILTIVTAPGRARAIVTGNRVGVTSDIVSRAFAPARGTDEDAATGSAHAVLGPYWAARLGRPELTAVQISPRGGAMTCRVDGERTILTANCVTVIDGALVLDDEA